MYRSLTIAELLAMAKQNDESAITEIYVRYRPLLFNQAIKILKNFHDAEDAVLETFTKFLDHKDTINIGPLEWLLSTTRNVCFDILKDKHYSYSATDYLSANDNQFQSTIDNSNLNYYQDPEINYQQLKNKHQIIKILNKLPTRYSYVLLLHDYQGYSCPEIAKQLGKSTNAIKSILYRARQKFRAISLKISPWLNQKYGAQCRKTSK
ncbi:MAG: sigma-70 family RNA polymerase sigma factor [candidate division WOR-3 bacterium]